MFGLWSRLSPLRSSAQARPLALCAVLGTAAGFAACQGPEPFHFDQQPPGTGGSGPTGGKANTGGTMATGGRATGGFPFPTGGVATGGRGTGGSTGGAATTGGVMATGGRATGGFGLGGSRTGGAGGSVGPGTGGSTGTVTNPCATQMVIVALNAGTLTANTLNVRLRVTNAGNDTLNLANLKLRYYFSYTSPTGGAAIPLTRMTYEIDNLSPSTIARTSVTHTVAATTPAPATATGADDYLEIGFTGTGLTLTPANSVTIEGRLHDTSYAAMFAAASDYSYVASATTYANAMKVVASYSAPPAAACTAWGVPPG